MLPNCIKIGSRRLSAGTTETLFRLSGHRAYISNTESCKHEMSANYCMMSFANNIFQIPWTCFYIKKRTRNWGGCIIFQGRLDMVSTSFVMWLAILLIPSAIPASTAFSFTCPVCSRSLQYRSGY